MIRKGQFAIDGGDATSSPAREQVHSLPHDVNEKVVELLFDDKR